MCNNIKFFRASQLSHTTAIKFTFLIILIACFHIISYQAFTGDSRKNNWKWCNRRLKSSMENTVHWHFDIREREEREESGAEDFIHTSRCPQLSAFIFAASTLPFAPIFALVSGFFIHSQTYLSVFNELSSLSVNILLWFKFSPPTRIEFFFNFFSFVTNLTLDFSASFAQRWRRTVNSSLIRSQKLSIFSTSVFI